MKASPKPDVGYKCGAMPDYTLPSRTVDSKSRSYLEAVSTRPTQSMNVIMTDVVRTSGDSGGKDGPINHSDTNSQRTSQGSANEGEGLPMVPLAVRGPADTLAERSDLEGPLKVL